MNHTKISDKGAKALIKALQDGKFPNLTKLNLSYSNISHDVKERLDNAPASNTDHTHIKHTQTNKSKLPIITASAGLLLGLSIAYFAGTATLTPVGATVAVFFAAAAVGTLVGYGIGKVSQKFFVESTTEHSKQGLEV